MVTKILLVDDHMVVREGLRSLIEKQPDMEVIAEASDGRAGVRLALKLRPDVVIMDVSMPNLNGIDATRQIMAKAPEIKVLALSMHHHKQFVFNMLKAGALGYLWKNCAFEELCQAIKSVMLNHVYLSPGITNAVVGDYVNKISEKESTLCPAISSREREVLQLIAEGKSTKEIASFLHISDKTVSTHREHIMEKLDIHSIVELAKYAIHEGLTSLDL